MNRPLRIALVAPYPVLPLSAGGKVRIVQLARALCRSGVDVTIIAPYHVTQRRALTTREPFTLRQVPYAPFLVPFLLVDRPFPYGMLVSYHPGYRAMLPVRLASFDVCQIDHPAFVDLVRGVPSTVPVVYGSQNVEFDYLSAESRPGFVRRVVEHRVRELERRLVDRAAHVFACTEADGRRFDELYGVGSACRSVLPNGVDLAAIDAERAERRAGDVDRAARLPRRAVFTGSNVAHNRAAVRAILERVAPPLVSDVEFVIAGPCARPFRGRGGPNVVLDPDGQLATYASPGVVGLNPIIGGSGSNLKLLHYLAWELPVLTTPFGLRGFEDLAPWVVAVELEGFADTLRGELAPPDAVREQLGRYEWDAIGRRALGVYETLVRN